VKEVRIDPETGVAEVIVPDYQLSLAIGKEGQNARLAARLTGWRVDIKSETQLAEEAAYAGDEWAQGEWIVSPGTGEQLWQPADGGPPISAEEWSRRTAESVVEEEGPAGTGAAAEAPAATEEAPAATEQPPTDEAPVATEQPPTDEAPAAIEEEPAATEETEIETADAEPVEG
jgi:N utilization substance protein A